MTIVEKAAQRFTDKTYHPAALVLLAGYYLSQGEADSAFVFADRRCRISPPPRAQDFLLRAKCLAALGDESAARRDYAKALELDPIDPNVNRLILEAGFGEQAAGCAERLLASPRADETSLHLALRTLWSSDYQLVVRSWRDEALIRGWAAWRDDPAPTVVLKALDGSEIGRSAPFDANPAHRLAAPGRRVTDFSIAIAGGATVARIEFPEFEGLGGLHFVHLDQAAKPARENASAPKNLGAETGLDICTIIVPIFDDLEITRQCLSQSARQALAGAQLEIVAVNDNPTHRGVAALLDSFRGAPGFRVIENCENLGYAGSINAALEQIEAGDVVLLNSDVLLPDNAIERLRVAAYSARDVGTVTPLSNNGELTSVPRGFQVNPLGTLAEIEAIDRTVSLANSGRTVTLPNGVGFCLYVKRASLDLVRRLPTIYGRGYCEDVDFCFQLQKRGRRNICATDVYVGHQGSASFKEAKRALVVRNIEILSGRFPNHHIETVGFVRADPLADVRRVIALEHFATAQRGTALFGASAQPSLRSERMAWLRRQGQAVFSLERDKSRARALIVREGVDGASISFSLDPDGARSLHTHLRDRNVATIEIVDCDAEAAEFFAAMPRDEISLTALFDSWPAAERTADRRLCRAPAVDKPCAPCAAEYFNTAKKDATRLRLALMQSEPARATRLVAANRMAEAAAIRLNLNAVVEIPSVTRRPPAADISEPALGVLCPRSSAETERLLTSLVHNVAASGNPMPIIVLGRTWSDLRIMAAGNAFVTGEIGDEDYSEALAHYGVGALFWPFRWRGFGLADRLSAEAGLPQAYFDWSLGALSPRGEDLAIDPRLCDEAALSRLVSWAEARLAR
jgi:O-antigen biosynthesis protein